MAILNVIRVSTLPDPLVANTIYLLATSTAGELQVVAVGTDIANPRKTVVKASLLTEVDTKIGEALADYYTSNQIDTKLEDLLGAANQVVYAADITARNALVSGGTPLTHNALVLVADATADTTVDAGAALYFLSIGTDNTDPDHPVPTYNWTKIAEFENMDVNLEDALAAIFTNLSVLKDIGENAAHQLTYKGAVVGDVVQGTHEW